MAMLFSPFSLRDLRLKNRLVVAPMCQYSAVHGLANDWHLVNLGRFAAGGFGLVIVEATGVTPEGRISYGDLGLWNDAQIAPLKRIVQFLHANGSAAAIQLAHAGRKASTPVAWRGGFNETESEKTQLGFEDWEPVAPSPIPHNATHKIPRALDEAGIERIRQGFADATRRALAAGFDAVEIHAAHGYLLNEFLSPVANRRSDRYGGSLANRMRFPLAVIETVREIWPASRPLLLRISTTDWIDGGWTVEDSTVFAREAKARGVDLVDCSSGGFDGAKPPVAPLYQVPLAAAVRRDAGVPTLAVGLITEPADAEVIVARGEADLVALARGALHDPNWPLHARHRLGGDDDPYGHWPKQAAARIRDMDRALKRPG